MNLLAHDMRIVHRPGAQNQVPDALSRAFEDFVCSVSEKDSGDAWYLDQLQEVQTFPEKFSDWKIEKGKLFVLKPVPWVDPLLGDHDAWKLVIPKELKLKVLEECHNNPTSGHFGNFKTHLFMRRFSLFLDFPANFVLIMELNLIII